MDVHNGWLIFKLPPSELAVHPSDENDMHEFYLMTDDLEVEIRALRKAGVQCDTVSQQGWGRSTRIQFPGGGTLGSTSLASKAAVNERPVLQGR